MQALPLISHYYKRLQICNKANQIFVLATGSIWTKISFKICDHLVQRRDI